MFKATSGLWKDLVWKQEITLKIYLVKGLSLKHAFSGCGHGFDGCDGLGGLGRFGGFDGFSRFGGFGGLDEFCGFDGFSGFGG